MQPKPVPFQALMRQYEPETALEPSAPACLFNALVEVERTMGIEPISSAWEAEVLPLNYARCARADTAIQA